MPTPVDDQLVEEVWSLTLGNPLFVTTVLAQMNHGQDDTGGGNGHGNRNEAVIDRLVAEQLSGVPADLRDALTVIALAEPIGAAIVEQLCDPHALVALERRLLIRPERHGRRIDVSMRHPLYGAHLRATASQLLARGIRHQLIDHLVALGAKRADDLRQLIDWSTASGRALPPDVAVRAAWYALRHGDPLHAERLGRRAWDNTGSVAAALVVCEARYAWGDGRAVHALAEAAASAAGGDAAGAAVARLAEVDRRTTTWKVGGDVPAPIEELEPIGATMAHVARARFADAETELRAFLATQPLRRPDELAVASAMLGWTMGWRGRPATGTAIAADAARALTASGHRPLARWAWVFTGDVAVAAGDHPVIDEAIAALTGPYGQGEETPTSFDIWIDIVIAGRHRLLHDFEASRALLRVAAERARAEGRWFDEVIALHDQVRSGSEADEVVQRLHALATDGRELAGMLARQASSETSDDVDGMVAITDELVAAGVLGYAAEALARAGELAAAAGDRRRARELGIRWQELMDQCERPAVPPPILTIDALTVREREVALLGMDGHTSRAIADRLGLSVRTVDNHLAHVFTKLGITSRSELVDALTRLQVH
ncbi:MAG: helix-turn-helix transcriptional regulator, partial [Actinomycetota bacterium]|nr:helix-turn-helix transcriptional regulator [Actinomycetota bacterium]